MRTNLMNGMIRCSLPWAYYVWGQNCPYEFYFVRTLITMHSYLSMFVWWWPQACHHTSHKCFRPLWRFLGPLFRDPDSCRGIWLNPAILPGSVLCQDWGWLDWALPHTTGGGTSNGNSSSQPKHTQKHRQTWAQTQDTNTHSYIHTVQKTDCKDLNFI